MPWRRKFSTPLVLKDGRRIVTIRDAADVYLTLPPDRREAAHWESALAAVFVAGRRRSTLLDVDAAHQRIVNALRIDGLM